MFLAGDRWEWAGLGEERDSCSGRVKPEEDTESKENLWVPGGPEQAQGWGGRLRTSLGLFRKTPPPRQLKCPHSSEAWAPRIFNLMSSTLGQGLAPKIGFTTTTKTFHNK